MSLGATSLIPGVWVAESARRVGSPIYYPAVTRRRLSQGVPRSCSRDLRILVCMQTNLPLLSMVAGEEYRPYLGEVGLAAKLQTSHLPLCMVAHPPPLFMAAPVAEFYRKPFHDFVLRQTEGSGKAGT